MRISLLRGCNLPSMCSLCGKAQEMTSPLFLDCSFAGSIWQWFSSIINLQCTFSSLQDAIQITQRNWSPLCKIVITAAIINIINTIWFCRNQLRFNEKRIRYMSAINMIISGTAMTGNKL